MNFMPRYPSASGPDAAGSAWALSLSSAWAAVCTETPSRRLEDQVVMTSSPRVKPLGTAMVSAVYRPMVTAQRTA